VLSLLQQVIKLRKNSLMQTMMLTLYNFIKTSLNEQLFASDRPMLCTV